MVLGWLSSYNTMCGIAEYSRYLVNAFRERDDIDLVVFGSKNYGSYKVADDPSYVIPTFGVPPWNGNKDHSFDAQAILDAGLDVLHVQYEVVLYNQEPFYALLSKLKEQGVLLAITYHDNCIPPNFPYYLFDLQYSHRENVGVGEGSLLPMGIENRTPVVKTFGLGRSRKDIIGEICVRNGWDFQCSFADDGWKDPEVLYNWLRDSDLIVLYYDEVSSAGVSIAARVAISTRRPVIVNNTTWFQDLTDTNNNCSNLTCVSDPSDLEAAMTHVLENLYIEECDWNEMAQCHLEDYQEKLSGI